MSEQRAVYRVVPPPGHSTRPSDEELVEALALRYSVTDRAVVAWLLDMNIPRLAEQLERQL